MVDADLISSDQGATHPASREEHRGGYGLQEKGEGARSA